ncbi:class I SAM-dependent methyltransferase [Flavobacterium filum]|uniref:class I SAM-dependent methyltransferase n=1 Tax=Flavobacterium filum TaxID=370974 RepID=UPI0004280596|nr:class I SAM-dependent methyltransferase [Flavobacterium filum]
MSLKEIDLEGMETLHVIEKANKFNRWMYETIKPFCKGRILEIGCGIGNISEFFIQDSQDIVLSDLRENYLEIVSKKFTNPTIKINLIDPEFDTKYDEIIGTFDTVFALNVIEHIEDDRQAIANCKKLLKKGGSLIILVPAYQFLFNNFDKELEHFRRYTRKKIETVIAENNLEIVNSFYFNFIGIIGWYISGSILKKKTIPENQMGLFNLLVPVFRWADKIILNKIGLSVICVSKKV